jgi:hypothetical protein
MSASIDLWLVLAQVQEPIEVDDPKDVIDFVVAGVALATVVFLYLQVRAAKQQIEALNKQIKETSDDAKIERSLAFQQRFTGREFRTGGSLFVAYLDVDDARDAVEKIRAWQIAPHAEDPSLPRSPRDPGAPSPSKNEILQVLDFFEELGTAFNADQIAQDELVKSFGSTPVQIYTGAWWFLCWRRRGVPIDETKLYDEFAELVCRIRKETPHLLDEKPTSSVRLLAFPSGNNGWEWRACAEFSELLSRRLDEHPELTLERVVGDAICCAASVPRVGEAELFAQVIAVPADIAPDTEDWRHQREAANRLKHQLRGRDHRALEQIMRNLERYWARVDADRRGTVSV